MLVIVHDPHERQWLRFEHPIEIVEARHTGDVVAALARVEALVNERALHAAGFISYEAAPAFDPALTVRGGASTPLLTFGLFRAPIVTSGIPRAVVAGELEPVALTAGLQACGYDRLEACASHHWTPSLTRAAYDAGIDRIKSYIAAGDTYQVNYTFRLQSLFTGDPWMLFQHLVGEQRPGYAAFIDVGTHAICSVSPELFFRLEDTTLTCRPMKGTAPRGRFPAEDRERAGWLRESEKNRAENVMIVDMIRNDIGRVAETGSVVVSSLFDVERYPTVWQMTSTVTGRTSAGIAAIMSAMFPCASITGAPKARTMQIIAELESTPRGLYTGCIGHIAPGRHAQFSVAIRTVVVDRETQQAEYGVGGGILWESEASSEYDECVTKARVLTEPRPAVTLLETILWEPVERVMREQNIERVTREPNIERVMREHDNDGYFLLDRHLDRLRDSADYFDIPLDVERVVDLLATSAPAYGLEPQVVRVLVAADGSIRCESAPLIESPSSVRLALAPTPIDSSNVFLFHKTTQRSVYESARAACPGADDVVLWNERGEVTETTIANIVVDIDGELFTPPVSCGLLGGTFRAMLVAAGTVRERVITIDMLRQCDRIHVVNSVRKWRPATLAEM